jgi:hypothetical protein
MSSMPYKRDKIIDNIPDKNDKKIIWDYIKDYTIANSKYKKEILVQKYKI